MLLVLRTIEIHPDDVDAAVAMARTMADVTLQEPGCIRYAFGRGRLPPPRPAGLFANAVLR
jgi:quinol monooxygenase YgiN